MKRTITKTTIRSTHHHTTKTPSTPTTNHMTPIKRNPTRYLREEVQQTYLRNKDPASTQYKNNDTFYEEKQEENTTAVAEEDPTLERTFKGHRGPISSISFDVDTRYFVSSSVSDSSIMLWDMFGESQTAVKYLGHTSGVYSTQFAPSVQNKHLFASGGKDMSIRLWVAKG
jgi:WD40 repeat protein